MRKGPATKSGTSSPRGNRNTPLITMFHDRTNLFGRAGLKHHFRGEHEVLRLIAPITLARLRIYQDLIGPNDGFEKSNV